MVGGGQAASYEEVGWKFLQCDSYLGSFYLEKAFQRSFLYSWNTLYFPLNKQKWRQKNIIYTDVT